MKTAFAILVWFGLMTLGIWYENGSHGFGLVGAPGSGCAHVPSVQAGG